MTSPNPPFPWATLALVALISAGLGALGAWNFLPREKSELPPPTSAAPAPMAAATPVLRDALSLGNWYYDHSQWADAAQSYQQVIAAGTDNADVRTDLGNCFRFLNQPQQALEQYQIAQKLNPQHENSLLNQAALYANVLHDHEKAAAVAQDFLRRFPQSAGAGAARQLLIKTD